MLCLAALAWGLWAAPPEPPESSGGPPVPAPRGNEVLRGDFKAPSYDVAAFARMVVMVGDARRLSQPVGYGFGFQLRVHPWRAYTTHIGFTFVGGHLRAPELVEVPISADEPANTTRRWRRFSTTDFAAGLSIHAPAGFVVLSADVTGGLAISEFFEPRNSQTVDDSIIRGYDPMLRGAFWVGVPIRNNHGLTLGLSLTKIFSGIAVELDDGETLIPFDLNPELSLGYQGWF